MAQTQTSNASNSLAVVLGTNQIVERCFAKMANDVTAQVRDKLIDIILAVIARECEDFDVELLRRLINAEIPDPTITIEKRVKTQDPESKTKTVELDAEGNPIKRARKEKAPKAAPKEPKAPKAVLSEEEKAALKAEKEAAKAVAKEAAKAAKQLERDAAKAAKALADAEKPAKPAKEPKAPKEVRLPIPWCGVAIPDRCQALRSYHGLFAQCVSDNTETCLMCPACEKAGAPFGTVAMRAACGLFDYTAPNGKKCVRLANVIDKFGLADAAEQAFHEEAAKHDITIPHEHLEKEVKQRGRPKSLSPRATKGKGKGKVATTDTTPASSRNASDADNSDTETETDEPVAVVAAKAPKATGEKKQKQQQARKKVEKTADAAAAAAADADAEAPKKRGRPAKAKEPVIEVNASLIQDLVSSASGRASDAAPSSVEEELVEELITPSAASPATPAKKAASPVTAPAAPKKPAALKKKARVTEVVEGMTLWVESFEGNKIWVHPETLAVYDASNGEGVGTWDDAAKTIIFEDDEETEIDQFSEEE
jgi:hypothetical protein